MTPKAPEEIIVVAGNGKCRLEMPTDGWVTPEIIDLPVEQEYPFIRADLYDQLVEKVERLLEIEGAIKELHAAPHFNAAAYKALALAPAKREDALAALRSHLEGGPE